MRIRTHFRTGPGRKNGPGLRSYAWTRCATHRQPLVNEKSPCGVSTIVHNQSPTRRDGRVDPLGDGRMPLPLRVPPDSITESEVARNLDEPKVATYVAKLDSICAAAQTRAKDEIQAIPRQNQAAVSEARDQVMRETIHTLRAAPSPRSVYWPYEGRAFPLMEKLFNEYPHMAQPPEEWLPLQIQRTPGLDKCIFPV